MAIKNSSAKAKGRELQKWVCSVISKCLKIPWGYEDEKLIQPRILGQSGTDVVLRGEAKKSCMFDIECKATESLRLYEDIEQAKKNTEKGRQWLIVHKRSYKNPIVVLDAEFFFKNYLSGEK